MAHFAQINEDNYVQQVIVVNNEVLLDENGNESEALGMKFCEETFGGRWVQTSYNSNFRVAFAGVCYYYNERLDAFVSPEI
jgi:hypothetical protein